MATASDSVDARAVAFDQLISSVATIANKPGRGDRRLTVTIRQLAAQLVEIKPGANSPGNIAPSTEMSTTLFEQEATSLQEMQKLLLEADEAFHQGIDKINRISDIVGGLRTATKRKKLASDEVSSEVRKRRKTDERIV
ncbi:hypothetical protein LTR81_027413 [Elasticomyces elasticus]